MAQDEGREAPERRLAPGGQLAAGDSVTVEKLRFDGTLKHAWEGTVIHSDPGVLILRRASGEEQVHPQSGETVTLPGPILEYHWLDRWYSVFCLFEADGTFQSYYADVRMPAQFEGRRVSYTDLELDLVVHPDLSHEVVDEDEFAQAAGDQGYPDEVRQGARKALAELLDMLERGREPFSSEALTP